MSFKDSIKEITKIKFKKSKEKHVVTSHERICKNCEYFHSGLYHCEYSYATVHASNTCSSFTRIRLW